MRTQLHLESDSLLFGNNYIRPRYKWSLLLKQLPQAIKAIIKFSNFWTLFVKIFSKTDQQSLLLTRDGLKILIRDNIWDSRIVWELFLEKPYTKNLALPKSPVVIDIGSYIAGFSLYAAKYLNAMVFAYEPIKENYTLARENIKINNLEAKIKLFPLAVGPKNFEYINVIKSGQEIHASSHFYKNKGTRKTKAISLTNIIKSNSLRKVDLLKLDCAEYAILEATPNQIFTKIQNIVFEIHQIPSYKKRATKLSRVLKDAGYLIHRHGPIVYASRD